MKRDIKDEFGLHRLSDEELILMDSKESFSTIFSRWSKRIFSFVSRKIKRKELAEEIFQEIMLKTYNGRKTFKQQLSFSGWIYSIAKNTIASFFRTKYLKNETLEFNADENRAELKEESYYPDLEERIFILNSLDSLSENLFQAFYLTSIQGMDHNEAAEFAKISSDNIRKRTSRAREYLKEVYNGVI